ncbi:unnamed protein product [Ectocarpus sp. 8 AP-2014]
MLGNHVPSAGDAADVPTKQVSRAAPQAPTVRRNTGGYTHRQSFALRKATLRRPTPPHSRTPVDNLHKAQQWRLHQLHHNNIKKMSRGGAGSTLDSRSITAYGNGDGPAKARRHWQQAMTEVLRGTRAVDSILDTDRFKDRKMTFWHGMMIKKTSKHRIDNIGVEMLPNQCRSCIDIAQRHIRESDATTTSGEADPDTPGSSSDEARMASPEEVAIVFDMFNSVPEVTSLDSIYKKRLFGELRLRHFAAGSTIFRQWEHQDKICVILRGRVHLTSKHSGVLFQAGTCNVGEARMYGTRQEVIGSIEPIVGMLTARCEAYTTVLCLGSDRFAAVVNDSVCAERVAKKAFLKCSAVFSTLDDDDLNTVETLFTTATLHDNQVICKEGSHVDHVYVVKRGFLRILKAFLPEEDADCRSGPPPHASTAAAGVASARRSSSAEVETRLKHFDLGEIRPKDMLGENGMLKHLDTSSVFSTTPAPVATETVALPAIASNQEDAQPLSRPTETPGDTTGASTPDGDAGDASPPPSDAATDRAGSSRVATMGPRKLAYIISAAASRGTAEVYVANVYDLKKLQTDSFRYCWKTAQILHQARAQAWGVGALAQQLRRQNEWEARKREVLSQL